MAKVAGGMNTTFIASVASLAFGALFFVLSIALLGASPIDIGLLSTAAVFLLLGAVGLILNKTQNPA